MPHLVKLHLFDGCWYLQFWKHIGLASKPLLYSRPCNSEELGDKPIGGLPKRIKDHRKGSLDRGILLETLITRHKVQATVFAAITLLSSHAAVLDEFLALTLLAAIHKSLLQRIDSLYHKSIYR
jgi:hypothetical protein